MIQQKEGLQSQVEEICNLCMVTGIQKNTYEGENKILSHIPISYYPYQITQSTNDMLRKAHFVWVKLLLSVSKDKQFVNKVFQRTAQSDSFVSRFLQLYNKYIDNEDYGVACIRIDYLGDENPQLVEYNLVSVGLNGISDAVQRLAQLYQRGRSIDLNVLYPDSFNQITFLNAIQLTLQEQKLSGIALMVVHEKHEKQFNFGDQNAFVLEALKRKIKVKKVTMSQLITLHKINEMNEFLYGQQVVCLVYFRTGYSPTHYPTQEHWILREQIEKARVLKIPSISMQLINFKRMQVEFTKLQVLEKYLNQTQAQLIKSIAGQLYDFQNQSHFSQLEKLAKTNKFILKSNREGGGNNYFGQEAVLKIQQFRKKPHQLQKYILQRKIDSKILDNIFITDYKYCYIKQCTSQFSTFGTYAYNKGQLKYNDCGGALIRIKRAEDNEGGIAINKAVIAGYYIRKK